MEKKVLDWINAEKFSKEVIAVDFDGVMHKNSKGYFDGAVYDDIVEGTKEALQFLSTKYKLIIYTCKADPERPLVNGKNGIELIEEWLEKQQINQYISGITNKKPRALFYIDDKAIRFTNWVTVIDKVSRLEKEFSGDVSIF